MLEIRCKCMCFLVKKKDLAEKDEDKLAGVGLSRLNDWGILAYYEV